MPEVDAAGLDVTHIPRTSTEAGGACVGRYNATPVTAAVPVCRDARSRPHFRVKSVEARKRPVIVRPTITQDATVIANA